MTRDDPRRSMRDLWRVIATARAARGDHEGARLARQSARMCGEGYVRQLGALGRDHWLSRRSAATGQWRRGA